MAIINPNTVITSVTVPSSSIEVSGQSTFTAAIAIAIEEIPEWTFLEHEGNNITLESQDELSSMTIFLAPSGSPAEVSDSTCVITIMGRHFTPAADYLYITGDKMEVINFI